MLRCRILIPLCLPVGFLPIVILLVAISAASSAAAPRTEDLDKISPQEVDQVAPTAGQRQGAALLSTRKSQKGSTVEPNLPLVEDDPDVALEVLTLLAAEEKVAATEPAQVGHQQIGAAAVLLLPRDPGPPPIREPGSLSCDYRNSLRACHMELPRQLEPARQNFPLDCSIAAIAALEYQQQAEKQRREEALRQAEPSDPAAAGDESEKM